MHASNWLQRFLKTDVLSRMLTKGVIENFSAISIRVNSQNVGNYK